MPMTSDEREIKLLAESAVDRIIHDDPVSAAWRLADALGILSRMLRAQGKQNVMGIDQRTGRGFKLHTPVVAAQSGVEDENP